MKTYNFYGWQTADCKPIDAAYKKIENPRHLYDILSEIWCAQTCAPRMLEILQTAESRPMSEACLD